MRQQLNSSNHKDSQKNITINQKETNLSSQINHRSQLDVYFNPSHLVDSSIYQDSNSSFTGIYTSNVGCRRRQNQAQNNSMTSNSEMILVRKSQIDPEGYLQLQQPQQQQKQQQQVKTQQQSKSIDINDEQTYQRFASMCAQIIQQAFRQYLRRKRQQQQEGTKQTFISLMTGVVQGWQIRKVMKLSRIMQLKEEMIPLIEIRRNIVFNAINKQPDQSLKEVLSTNKDYAQIQSTLIPFFKELNILVVNLASSGLWVFDDRHYASSTVQHITGLTVLQSPQEQKTTTNIKQSDRFYKTPGNNSNRILKQNNGEMGQTPWQMQQMNSIDRNSNGKQYNNNSINNSQYNYNISYDNNISNNCLNESPFDSINHQHKFNNAYIRQLSKQSEQLKQQELQDQESQRYKQQKMDEKENGKEQRMNQNSENYVFTEYHDGEQRLQFGSIISDINNNNTNSPPVSARFEGGNHYQDEQHKEQKENEQNQQKYEMIHSQHERDQEDKGKNHIGQDINDDKQVQQEKPAFIKDNDRAKNNEGQQIGILENQQVQSLDDQKDNTDNIGTQHSDKNAKIEGVKGDNINNEGDVVVGVVQGQQKNVIEVSQSDMEAIQNDNRQQQVIKSTNKWDDMPVGKGRKIEISEYPMESPESDQQKKIVNKVNLQKLKKNQVTKKDKLEDNEKEEQSQQKQTSQDKGKKEENSENEDGDLKVDEKIKRQMKSNDKKVKSIDKREYSDKDDQKKQENKVTKPKYFLTPKKPSECSIEGSNIDSSSNSSRYSSQIKIPQNQEQQVDLTSNLNQHNAEKNFLKKGQHSGGKKIVSQKLNWKRVGSKVDCWSTSNKHILGEDDDNNNNNIGMDGGNRKSLSSSNKLKVTKLQTSKSAHNSNINNTKYKNSHDQSLDQQDSQNNQSIEEFSFTKAQQKQQQQQQQLGSQRGMKKGVQVLDKGDKQIDKSNKKQQVQQQQQNISNKQKRSSSSDWLHSPMDEQEITEILESQPPSALQLPTIDGLQSNMAEMLKLRDALIPFIQTNLMFLDHKDPRIFTKIAKEIIKQASGSEYSN